MHTLACAATLISKIPALQLYKNLGKPTVRNRPEIILNYHAEGLLSLSFRAFLSFFSFYLSPVLCCMRRRDATRTQKRPESRS